MPPPDPRAILTAVADRLADQVAALGGRVAIDRAPGGTGTWDLTDGPYAVVGQTGPALPEAGGDGVTIVDVMRVSAAIWQAPDDTSTVVPDTIAALEGWPADGIRPRGIGAFRVPQPEDDVLRTEVEVRYAHRR